MKKISSQFSKLFLEMDVEKLKKERREIIF